MSKNTPHLKDLFTTGRPLTISVFDPSDPAGDPTEVEIWMRKPTAPQYEEALSKARGKAGRRRQLYRKEDSDEYLGIYEEIRGITEKDQLVDEILNFEMNELRTQAYHEALYGDSEEEKPRWGKEGADYLDVLAGLRQRYEEIEEFNSQLDEEDHAMKIKPEEDEEIVRLNEYIDEFSQQREEILERLTERKRSELSRKTAENLRKELMKRMVDLDVNLVQHQEFKTMMVYFAARYPDNHSKQYFKSPDDIWEFPEHIRLQLFNAYDELEHGAADLKN